MSIIDPYIFLKTIRERMPKYKYRVGDPVEKVAYYQGQEDLLTFVEEKILNGPTTTPKA